MFCGIGKENFATNFSCAISAQLEDLQKKCKDNIILRGYAIYKGYLFPQTVSRIEGDGTFVIEVCGQDDGLYIYRICLNPKFVLTGCHEDLEEMKKGYADEL